MTSIARLFFLAATTSLLGGCAASAEATDVSEASGTSAGALTFDPRLSDEKFASVFSSFCNNPARASTPELLSPGRNRFGQLTSESATWRRVSCVADGFNYAFVWERTLGGRSVRATVTYDLAHHTATVINAGECEAVLGPSHGTWARYTCNEADDRLRVWMEGDKNVKLVSLHPACNERYQSRSMECTAAAHRFCLNNGYGAGITQEVGVTDFGIACFPVSLSRDATWEELRSYHSACSDPQGHDCMAAVHRLCNAYGYTGGLIEELGPGVAGVNCFAGGSYESVPMSALGGCVPGQTSGVVCTSSVHGYCSARGFAGGLVQEVGTSDVGVACFDGGYFLATVK
jgi:hypothetical protein